MCRMKELESADKLVSKIQVGTHRPARRLPVSVLYALGRGISVPKGRETGQGRTNVQVQVPVDSGGVGERARGGSSRRRLLECLQTCRAAIRLEPCSAAEAH